MIKKLFLFFCILLLLVSGVFAQPFTQINVNPNVGLQIEFPDFVVGKVNTALTFPFHVYNVSNGVFLNDSVECWLHVYNGVGSHILESYQNNVSHNFDYEFSIPSSLFNETDVYRFVVTCVHSSGIGGFVAHGFEITESGEVEVRDNPNFLMVIVLIPLIFALFMIIGGATMGEDHHVLRVVLFLLSVPMVWISLHWSMIGVVEFFGLPNLQNAIGDTTYWLAWFFFVLVSYFVIYAIWKASDVIAQKKNERFKY